MFSARGRRYKNENLTVLCQKISISNLTDRQAKGHRNRQTKTDRQAEEDTDGQAGRQKKADREDRQRKTGWQVGRRK